MTPLMWAVLNNWQNTVSILLKRGASPNVKNDGGWTGLMLAVGNPVARGTARSLLAHGGDVTAEDGQGQTPLIIAVHSGATVAVVRLLLEHGSDVNAKDSDGQTLNELARKEHRPDIVGLLKQYGAKK